MKHTHIYSNWISLLFGFSCLTFGSSCKKMIDAGAPKVQIGSSTLYGTTSGATSALLGVYTSLEGYNDISFTLLPGLSADELISYATPVSMYYTNALNANVNNDFWSKCYKYIYQANDVIAQVTASAGISDADRQQLTGEAYFLRAFCHFYLVNFFGDIPYITGTDYAANNLVSRMPVDTVYARIISDLQIAQSRLGDNYPTGDRTRVNKSVATALLARAYLYHSDWTNAETQATAVIANPAYHLEDSLNNVFLVNSKEALWQLSPNNTSYTNAVEGISFVLSSIPQFAPSKAGMSDSLYNSFETGDLRKVKWTGSYSESGSTWHFSWKYKVNLFNQPVSEYTVAMRLAEQYLLRAEARAQQNKIADAITDLNAIRHRAGLPNIDPGSTSQPQCLALIQHERRVELFVEWGHRWLDLKRTGTANTVMPAVCTAKGGTWKPEWQLYPIPQVQLNADPNMTSHQNPGYQ